MYLNGLCLFKSCRKADVINDVYLFVCTCVSYDSTIINTMGCTTVASIQVDQ